MTIAFNEAFMGDGEPLKGSRFPGFGAANRTPDTSRVHRHRAAGGRSTVTLHGTVKPVRKGLARASVAVVRKDARTFEVVVKGSRQLVGIVRKVRGAHGEAYSYQLKGEGKAHKGFPSQKAAVARMLEKI